MEGTMGDTLGSQTVSTKLQKIAEQAARYPEMVFTTLAHLIDMDFLKDGGGRVTGCLYPEMDRKTSHASRMFASLTGNSRATFHVH